MKLQAYSGVEHRFNFFLNLHGNAFPFFIFLNERSIETSFLMTQLKCTVVHYPNLNSSSVNKPFLNYGPLNMLFRFFRFLIYVYFNKAFVKNSTLYSFNTNFQNSFQDVDYLNELLEKLSKENKTIFLLSDFNIVLLTYNIHPPTNEFL